MMNKPTDAINLLLQLGKIGTRVQLLREDGDLYPDQLFFKSLTDPQLCWSHSKKSLSVSPGKLMLLEGKLTGLLSVAPSVCNISDQLCLGIVTKDIVLEIVFQNARDRSIWSNGLQILAAGPSLHFSKTTSPSSAAQYYVDSEISHNFSSSWLGDDIIQWHEITNAERRKLEHFYSFLLHSSKGAVFYRYQAKKLKLPQKILVKLDEHGHTLQCLDGHHKLLMEIPFDSQVSVLDRQQNTREHRGKDNEEERKQNDKEMEASTSSLSLSSPPQTEADREEIATSSFAHFRYAPSSMHCFSIVRKAQSVHIGCTDAAQYQSWRNGLEYLVDRRDHLLRMKARRAIIAGDFVLSPAKQLIESPLRQKQSQRTAHEKHDVASNSSSFWGLFG
mmetsp:Transcript_6728/g.11045  ORF Transcript_6728/g.11045 Transcript_6728/m.11045 type:complete len:389 (+) Transcript_6728:64-1230(+)